MADEIGTIGTQLQVGDGASPEVFTTIGGVTGVPTITAGTGEKIDITALEDLQRRYLPGMKDPSDVTIPWVARRGSTELAQMESDDASAASPIRNYRVVESDGTTVLMSFSAFVNGFSATNEAGDAVRGETILVLDGRPTYDFLS